MDVARQPGAVCELLQEQEERGQLVGGEARGELGVVVADHSAHLSEPLGRSAGQVDLVVASICGAAAALEEVTVVDSSRSLTTRLGAAPMRSASVC